MKLLAAAVLALALASSASAAGWTTIVGSGLVNIVDPSLLRTKAGSELISFETPNANTISVARNGAAPRVLVSGDPIAGETQLVQQPDGTIQLYFPNADGVARLTSTDDGQTWTGPVQTQSHDVGGVVGAAVRPDGTPLFSQDGTGFVNVFQGSNGEVVHNVFPHCCGYKESLAVDSTGLAQVAFWSNATGQENFVYDTLDASGNLVKQDTPSGYSASATTGGLDRTPLVANGLGDTFLAWRSGYPTTEDLFVTTYRGGNRVRQVKLASGGFAGPDPRMALAVDASNRLWALWTKGGAVWGARSRTSAKSFGAAVRVAAPGSVFHVEGLARPDGSVLAVVNTGSGLASTRLLPGLSVRLFATTAHAGEKTIVTHWAQALDDSFGVGGATFAAGGRSVHADASGKAKLTALPRHKAASVSASGYASTGFRTP